MSTLLLCMYCAVPGAQQNSPEDLPPAVIAVGRDVTDEMWSSLMVLFRALHMVEREVVGWQGLLYAL